MTAHPEAARDTPENVPPAPAALALAPASQTPATPLPLAIPWIETLIRKYQAGVAHAFCLHFNVADYVLGSQDLRAFLVRFFLNRPLIVFSNRAQGFTFPQDSMRETFTRTLGLQALAPDPALAALTAVRGMGGPGAPGTLPGQALPLIGRLLSQREVRVAIILDFAETLFPDGDIASLSAEDRAAIVFCQQWARDAQIAESENLFLLVTRTLTDIHAAIRAATSGVESILLPLPGYEERLGYIHLLQQTGSTLEMPPEHLAMVTAGLSKRTLEDIKLRAQEAGTPVTVDLVRERKEDIIWAEFGDVIEIVEPTLDYSLIGGLEAVKRFMKRSIIEPFRTGNRARVPMGVLLTGPAGTGKSALVQATARESGLNMVNLNLAKILGGYVGASEKNLEKALLCIQTLAPTLVFVDEIDQSFSRGQGGDSGVSSRLFKRLLEFMADTGHRGRICVLAATNRPDLMDAALKRPGRFDKKVPCLPPDEAEREAIFACMYRKYGLDSSRLDLAGAAARTEGYTGAEIEAVVLKSYEVASDAEREETGVSSAILPEDLAHALWAVCPSTAAIDLMTALALLEVSDRDLIPVIYQALSRQELTARAQSAQAPEAAADRENPDTASRGRSRRSLSPVAQHTSVGTQVGSLFLLRVNRLPLFPLQQGKVYASPFTTERSTRMFIQETNETQITTNSATVSATRDTSLLPVLSDLASQREALARETGEEPDRFGVIHLDWNEIAGKTIVLTPEIRSYEARRRASLEDLGLEESFRQDPEYAGSLSRVMNLGSRRLLPPEILNALAVVEATARRTLAEYSYASPYGRLVPRRAYPVLRTRLLELQAKFYGLRDELVANFDAARAQMEETYRQLAKGAWRTSLAWNLGDPEPPAAYVAAYVARALSKLPETSRIAGRYSFAWTPSSIVLPSQLVAELELARLLSEQAEVERQRLELEQQGLQEQQDWATEESRQKRRLAIEAERQRLEAEVQIAREVSEATAKARQEQVVEAIHTVAADLRAILYEAVSDVLASVRRNDRLLGRSVEQLKHLIERVTLLNFTNDAQVAAITGQLEAMITVKAEQRDLPAIREKLGDIRLLLRSDLIGLDRSIRGEASGLLAEIPEEEVPPLEQVRRIRHDLAEPHSFTLEQPEPSKRRKRGVTPEARDTGSLWSATVSE